MKCLERLQCLLWQTHLCQGRHINNCNWSKILSYELACISLTCSCVWWEILIRSYSYKGIWESNPNSLEEWSFRGVFFSLLELLCEDICSVERGSSLLLLLPMGLISFHGTVWENNPFLWDAFIIMLCSSANQIKNEDEGAAVWSLC